MKKEKPSVSAAGVALIRAIEAQKPETERICYDPYASAMVPGGIPFTLSKFVISSGLYERMAPGAAAFIILRERYFDDLLEARLGEGLDQVVILGAGYDTRALRIPGIERTRVFEIDQPATQNLKLERLRDVVDPLPSFLTFLPLDFNRQSLGERLQSGGYSEHAKTLFIMQGVTFFLTKEGVDNTLCFIAEHSGLGSTVIFDYVYNEVLSDTHRADVKALQRAARISREDYVFGIDRGQIGPFLNQRGFRDVQNLTLEDLKQKYFAGMNAGRVVPTGIAIASATVRRGAN